MRKIISLVQWIFISILILVFAYNLIFIYKIFVNSDDMPVVFGYTQAVVVSGSMEDALSVGDFVVYRQSDSYKEGDIICYSQNSNYITHRIVEITEEGYITKGDANNVADKDPVSYSQIKGAVIFAIPTIGNAILFFKEPIGILILFGAFAIVLKIVNSVGKSKKSKENQEETKE